MQKVWLATFRLFTFEDDRKGSNSDANSVAVLSRQRTLFLEHDPFDPLKQLFSLYNFMYEFWNCCFSESDHYASFEDTSPVCHSQVLLHFG